MDAKKLHTIAVAPLSHKMIPLVTSARTLEGFAVSTRASTLVLCSTIAKSTSTAERSCVRRQDVTTNEMIKTLEDPSGRRSTSPQPEADSKRMSGSGSGYSGLTRHQPHA